jgi:hypothetical protein
MLAQEAQEAPEVLMGQTVWLLLRLAEEEALEELQVQAALEGRQEVPAPHFVLRSS